MMRRLPVPALDLALALLLLAATLAELLAGDAWGDGPRLMQVVAPAFASLTLAARRRAPFAAVLAYSAAVGVMCVATEPPQILSLGLAGMLMTYSVGAGLEGPALWGGVAAFALAALARDVDDPTLESGDMLIDVLFFGGAFVAGRAVRRRQHQVEHVARAAAGRTEDAIRDERRRIAGELHDVIAHGMSTMVVQADAARQGLADEDAETRAALSAIEDTGREALREMRRLLGLLHEDDGDAAQLAPQPGIGELPGLVRSVQRAGLPVDLRIDGEPVPLSPGTDLAAYRIVQEALTNTLRHAGPARATVRVSYAARDLALDVSDTGRGGASNGDGAGKGLIGMRERALLYGGSLEAGPAGQGFRVSARLPLTP